MCLPPCGCRSNSAPSRRCSRRRSLRAMTPAPWGALRPGSAPGRRRASRRLRRPLRCLRLPPTPDYRLIADSIVHAANVRRMAGATMIFVADDRALRQAAEGSRGRPTARPRGRCLSEVDHGHGQHDSPEKSLQSHKDLQDFVIAKLRQDKFDVVQVPGEADAPARSPACITEVNCLASVD